MRRSGVKANGYAFIAALQACAFVADLESGREVHSDVLQSGNPTDLFVCNCLVDMYAKCGELKDAPQVFDSMATKGVVTWNALIAGYGKCHKLTDARQVFDNMATKDVVTWNTLIAGYAKSGDLENARYIFDSMATKDLVTWNALIAGYAKSGELEDARHIFDSMATKDMVMAGHRPDGMNLGVQHTSLPESGRLPDCMLPARLHLPPAVCSHPPGSGLAGSAWDADERRFLGSAHVSLSQNLRLIPAGGPFWNALIAGYAQQGLGQEALVLYGQMEKTGLILADHVTFICLLKACASTGAL